MFKDFHLGGIVRKGTQLSVFRIPITQQLQSTLSVSWSKQLDKFEKDIDEIEYDAGYKPDSDERFVIDGYHIPEEFNKNILDLDEIDKDIEKLEKVKGIFAKIQTKDKRSLILFQNFSPTHVIRPERFLFLKNGTYEGIKDSALSLDWKLSAVYYPKEHKLLFNNFGLANRFLPLKKFHETASEEEILEVLDHKALMVKNPELLSKNASHWFRTRFAMLAKSKILDDYSAKEIEERSKSFEIGLKLENERIVFPDNKPESKVILRFLCEETYFGPITHTKFETNSKRKAGK